MDKDWVSIEPSSLFPVIGSAPILSAAVRASTAEQARVSVLRG